MKKDNLLRLRMAMGVLFLCLCTEGCSSGDAYLYGSAAVGSEKAYLGSGKLQ